MYKAIVSFSGKISMSAGEVRAITDTAVIKDLLKAKYIEAVEAPEEKTKQKAAAKTAKAVKS